MAEIDWEILWFLLHDRLSNFSLFFVIHRQILWFHLTTDWKNSLYFPHALLKKFMFFHSRWWILRLFISNWSTNLAFLFSQAIDKFLEFFSCDQLTNFTFAHTLGRSLNFTMFFLSWLMKFTVFSLWSFDIFCEENNQKGHIKKSSKGHKVHKVV